MPEYQNNNLGRFPNLLRVCEANEVLISSHIYIYIGHLEDIQTALIYLKKFKKFESNF